jgi:small subunit ribosomal protein S8e
MAISQRRPRRKASGGRYTKDRSKKLYELGNGPTNPKIGKKKVIITKAKYGLKKTRVHSNDMMNLYDPKTKTYKMVKMLNEIENNADVDLARRNILTKGAIIVTEQGKAKITSRPGQAGTVNGVLLSE